MQFLLRPQAEHANARDYSESVPENRRINSAATPGPAGARISNTGLDA